MAITLKINGKKETVTAAEGTPLLWVLRDHLGLTGAKFGCGVAQCGACTVHVDGAPIRSCITPHEDVEGSEVTTIESANGKVASAIRAAWEELAVPQCGYCQAGQIMSAINLLETNASPSDEDIDSAMDGNICRCATYVRIRKAIMDAAKTL
ncbi:MAG: (2Fe-2S)-binding protein [Acidimicrobiales bacterium]|nr:(2Fe-2S)-binding protein [Hyphomonadaceae bacterium]RZV37280.1 MAG: (2Fe-2S)-binding protein [Acidimicrobiales bacterium]